MELIFKNDVFKIICSTIHFPNLEFGLRPNFLEWPSAAIDVRAPPVTIAAHVFLVHLCGGSGFRVDFCDPLMGAGAYVELQSIYLYVTRLLGAGRQRPSTEAEALNKRFERAKTSSKPIAQNVL